MFQGRYKAILCDRDAYLLELVRYIHLNPARLRQPLDPYQYRWSSHGSYLGQPSGIEVETTLVLGQFSHRIGTARKAYQRFLAEGVRLGHQADYYAVVDQRFLGEPDFIEAVQQRIGAKGEIAWGGPAVAFPRLVDAVAQVYDVDPQALLRPGRHRAWVQARAMLVYLAREWGGLSTKELGQRLHRDPSMISRLCTTYATARDTPGERRMVVMLQK